MFSIEAGRGCATGAGEFLMETDHASTLFELVDKYGWCWMQGRLRLTTAQQIYQRTGRRPRAAGLRETDRPWVWLLCICPIDACMLCLQAEPRFYTPATSAEHAPGYLDPSGELSAEGIAQLWLSHHHARLAQCSIVKPGLHPEPAHASSQLGRSWL